MSAFPGQFSPALDAHLVPSAVSGHCPPLIPLDLQAARVRLRAPSIEVRPPQRPLKNSITIPHRAHPDRVEDSALRALRVQSQKLNNGRRDAKLSEFIQGGLGGLLRILVLLRLLSLLLSPLEV